jgi:membrane-associated phospholipid phosphatase
MERNGAAARRFRLDPIDVTLLAYATFALVWILVRPHALLPSWWGWALGHVAVIGGIVATAATCRWEQRGVRGFWRRWDAFAWIIALFLMSGKVGHALNPRDWDPWLISIEHATGGLALLQWVQSVATRPLDEAAKILWTSYYFLALLPGVPLSRRPDLGAFREAKLAIAVGFVLSFLGYLLLPALGPLRFKAELGLSAPTTGVLIAGALKQVVTAMHGTETRYAFPSGHALATALYAWLLVRHRVRPLMWLAVPYCVAVILSTLLLRYHYPTDVVAGLVLAALSGVIAVQVHARWVGPIAGTSGETSAAAPTTAAR